VALVAGCIAAGVEFSFEMLASRVRFYWLWYPHGFLFGTGPPLQNSLTWFAAGFIFSALFREDRVSTISHTELVKRPLMILIALLAVSVAAAFVIPVRHP
jgi:uncharacterized membrane protein